MYFFTFEMKFVYITLQSQTYEQYDKMHKYTSTQRFLCLAFNVICSCLCLSIYFRKFVLNYAETNYFSTVSSILISIRSLLFLMDIYIAYLFCKFFVYFAVNKILSIYNERKLSCFNILMINWVIILYIFYFITLFLKYIFAPVSIQKD